MSEGVMTPALARIKEWLVYALIFLFPVAGVSVRHWFSAIFVLLALISLWDLVRQWGKRPVLLREEKIWLWLCVVFFLSFLVSSWVNGWTQQQNRALGVDVRYLLVVPLYLMLRHYTAAGRCLLAGMMVAAAVLAAQAYYDVEVLRLTRAQGSYSPNLLGPVAALVVVWLLSSWKLCGKLRWLLPPLVLAALWAVVMSGSRGAYIGLLAMLLIWCGLFFKGWLRAPAFIAVLLLPVVAYHSFTSLAERVDVAVSEVNVYFEQLEQGEYESGGSINVRFEMWRAGWMAFKDAPLLGIGPNNYKETVRQYVGVNGLSEQVAQHGQAHSAYVDILMARGLVGFLIFIVLLFYPLYFFMKTRQASPATAIFGVVHIVGFAAFSLTDASPFDKGNFVAIYLLCMSIFLSRHMAAVKQRLV